MPLAKGSIADANLAANLIDPGTRLCMLERKGNLLFRKFTLFNSMSLFCR
jgi:hypothetical protein